MSRIRPAPEQIFRSLNPATGETLEVYATHTGDEISRALDRSMSAFRVVRALPVNERAGLLMRVAERLEARLEDHARLITTEMGKPIAEARAEIRKCAATCRTTAELGPGWLAPMPVAGPARSSSVRFEGLGPILAIMPWNFPFWQVIRFFAPAFIAGNTAIIKHAENVPRCASAVEATFLEAGMPDGTLINLRIDRATVGELIRDRRIRSVTVTGGVRAGRAVAEIAGSAGKKAVLELGGSDPLIVFASADFDAAVSAAVASRFANSGQSCVCAKQFLVERPIFDAFTDAFIEETRNLSVGDPMNERHAIGTLARLDLRTALEEQVVRTVSGGARVVLEGGRIDGPGAFFAPVVLTVVGDSPAAHEELFGPVAPIFPFDDEEDAVRQANASDFGLASAIWTADEAQAERLVPMIEAGAVFINDIVRSDACISFGGIKDSGYGRELGQIGAHEFVNAKTVWVG